MKRGEVVIVNFQPTAPKAKTRPALIVQNDRDNARMVNTVVAQITSNTRRAGEDTQLLIDQSHVDRSRSGLRMDSVVNCSNLPTIQQADVIHVIGSLSKATMREIDQCLKASLGIA